MPTLTDNELRALAYYAVGVTSEGKDMAYRLSFAGNHLHEKDGSVLLKPIGNSGYSVGEMQTDLGQHHDDAAALVSAYQDWAKANHPGAEAGWALSDAEQAKQTALLQRDGHHIREPDYDAHNQTYRSQHGVDMPSRLLPQAGQDIDPTFKSHFDTFLATATGKAAVDRLDAKEVDKLVSAVAKPLRDNVALYRNADPEEQAQIFAVTAKVYNQSQTRGNEILGEMGQHKINSLAELSAKIDTFPDGPSHYMRTGRDAALAGARVFNALQGAGKNNPLREAWQQTMTNPLAGSAPPAGPQPHRADERAAVKGLFVQPNQGNALIAALEHGGSYAYGDPAHAHSRGFYAEGRDFLQWDRNGQGHAFIGGEWSAFSRDDVSLTHNHDHSLDVDLARGNHTQRLLHVTHPEHHARAHDATTGTLYRGARGEAVTALQTELAKLGYTDSRGQALQADGDFGKNTLHAVEAFQRDHGLAANGEVDPRTHAALQTATDARKMEASVVCDAPSPLMNFSDPSHPQNPLYAKLQDLLPAATTEARLAQATTACHLAGIDKPEELAGIYSGDNERILFASNSLFAGMAEMNVGKPAPTVQQSLQQVQQFDQQQQLQMQQVVQRQPAHGPIMHP